MWEFLAALFGGASILTKVASDNVAQKRANITAEERKKIMSEFWDSITNREIEAEVNKMMADPNRAGEVAEKIQEAFSSMPELVGHEHLWNVVDKKEYRNNEHLIRIILCVQRGCLPFMDVFGFRLFRYYVTGDTVDNIPSSISISHESYHGFAKWVTTKMQEYNSPCYLEYVEDSQYSENFFWRVTGID